MPRPSFFKRTYLVNRSLQIKYAAMIGIVLAVMLLLTQVHTYYTIRSLYPYIGSSFVGRQIGAIQRELLVNGLFYLLAVVVLSVIISNRIAGPIHRLEKTIDQALAADEQPGRPLLPYVENRILFRDDDEFHSLAEKVGRLIEKLAQARKLQAKK